MYEETQEPKPVSSSEKAPQSKKPQVEGFIDQRAENIAQLKLKDLATESAEMKQATQLKAKSNNTGLPDSLKSGIENLSGHSMDDVKVHYNSPKPAQLQAHAYAQGTDIHIASGQEKHLPHEAWHVVQQKQGRVKPTVQLKGKVNVNDDVGLEKEADVMGAKANALHSVEGDTTPLRNTSVANNNYAQRVAWTGIAAVGTTNFEEIQVGGQAFQGNIHPMVIADRKANKQAAIIAIAEALGTSNPPAQDNFHTAKSLRSIPADRSIDPTSITNTGKRNNYNSKLDPFQIKITASYGTEDDTKQIALYYQFAKSSYGYVVQIDQEGESYEMHGERGQDKLAEEQEAGMLGRDADDPLYKMFASGHESEGSEKIHEVAAQTTSDLTVTDPDDLDAYPINSIMKAILKFVVKDENMDRLKEKSKRLDAIAKIAGEGPRWECVRALAASGNLRNTSKIYTKQDPTSTDDNPQVYYVTFKSLWGSWKGVFNNAFNILDGTVAARLRDNDAWGGDGKISDKRVSDMGGSDIEVQ